MSRQPDRLRVLILNPPAVDGVDYIREGRCMQSMSSWTALLPPVTLMTLSSILRQDGCEVRLVDAVAQRLRPESVLDDAAGFAPHLLVLNTAFPSIHADAAFARQAAERVKGLRTVAIGMLPTVLPAEAMARYPWLDHLVVGEPERPVQMLAERLARGEGAAGVPGVSWRESDGSVRLPDGPFIEPILDSLPFPDRRSLDPAMYRFPLTGEPLGMITFSRGCPNRCTFCLAPVYYGRRCRERSVDSLIREISECRNVHGIRALIFWGEMVTFSRRLLTDLCERIIAERLDILWMGAARADQLEDEKLAALMRGSGCHMITLGMESASAEVLRRAHKGLDVEQSAKAAEVLRRAGIKVMGHFVFGLPGETDESARATIDFAKRHCDYAQFYCAVPYPGTPLAEEAAREGWLASAEWTEYDFTNSLLSIPGMSPRRIESLRAHAFRAFYLRPAFLWRQARDVRIRALIGRLGFGQWMRGEKHSGVDSRE